MSNEKLILRAMKYGIPLGIALLCAVLFAACDHPVTAPLENGYGRISVSCTEAQARTLLPETKDFTYKYFFTKGTEAEEEKTPDENGFFTLETGAYTVRVEAYLDDALVATGQSDPFTVGSGVNAPVKVKLTPASATGTGTFSYDITYPEGAVATVTLLQWSNKANITLGSVETTISEDGTMVTKTLQQPQELDAGSYLLTVIISKGGKYAGTSEAVHISPSVPTVYRATFDNLIELITISKKDIPGVTAPVAGAAPVTEITATDEYTGTVEWSPNDAAFQAETVYTATITLKPKTDYTLFGVAPDFFKVAGATSTNAAHSGVITAIFHNYAVSLTPSANHTFTAATYGYTTAPAALDVTVTNTGNQSTGALTASLSGTNADSFTLSTTTIGSIAVSGSGTFTVKPETGLDAGTHAATVTVSGGNGISKSFGVSFTVNPKTITFVVDPIPTQNYTGSAIEPAVTVKDGTTTLTKDTDYTVSYANNINTGTATVTITGKGNYLGNTKSATFTIAFITTNVAELGVWLSDQPTNTKDAPYIVKLNVNNLTSHYLTSDTLGFVLLDNPTKYVSLDLSGSTLQYDTIPGSAFRECTNLTSIDIPDGVTAINDNAFNGCTWLTSIEIPDSVIRIGIRAFEGCTELKSIELPNGISQIDDNAFEGCTGLISIEMPSNLSSGIGTYVFSGCSSLTSIEIPAGITTIEMNAFDGCLSLTKVEFKGAGTTIADDNSFPYGTSLRTAYSSGGAGIYIFDGTTWTKQS